MIDPRARLALLCLALIAPLTWGCDETKKKSAHRPDATSQREASSGEVKAPGEAPPSENNSAERLADPKLKALHDGEKIKAARAPFAAHLKRGRELVQAKRYEEGLEELEKARAIDPNNARILSEVGFAALLADKLDEATQANTLSVRFAKNDDIKAASLYNLGRVAEKERSHYEAIDHYTRSLQLRDHDAVRERLSALLKLTDQEKGGEQVVEGPPCELVDHGQISIQKLCETLAEGMGFKELECRAFSPYSDPIGRTSALTPGTGFKRAQIVHFFDRDYPMEEHYALGILSEDGRWFTLPLQTLFNPGAFGIYNRYEEPRFEIEELAGDGTKQLVVHWTRHYTDTDMGILEAESEESQRVIVIGMRGKNPALLANFEQKYTYLRDRLEVDDEEIIDPQYTTPGLPIASTLTTRFEATGDGSLKIETQGEGRGEEVLKSGTYPLGAEALRRCDD